MSKVAKDMRMISLSSQEEELLFARESAKDFKEHPEHCTYGNIEKGGFLALRWGMGNDCVLVLKLDEYYEPTNYQRLVKVI
jgi:hypothetical protein